MDLAITNEKNEQHKTNTETKRKKQHYVNIAHCQVLTIAGYNGIWYTVWYKGPVDFHLSMLC